MKTLSRNEMNTIKGGGWWDYYCCGNNETFLGCHVVYNDVKANLGLCYLVQNDEPTATEYYIEALSDFKKMPNKMERSTMLNSVLRDINNVLKKQPVLKGADEIKSMYKNELAKSMLN